MASPQGALSSQAEVAERTFSRAPHMKLMGEGGDPAGGGSGGGEAAWLSHAPENEGRGVSTSCLYRKSRQRAGRGRREDQGGSGSSLAT